MQLTMWYLPIYLPSDLPDVINIVKIFQTIPVKKSFFIIVLKNKFKVNIWHVKLLLFQEKFTFEIQN